VNRVVVLGRGAAGKSTAARRLGRVAGSPVIELDEHFWRPGLVPTPPDEWARVQRELASTERWIMDGDLGPYDVLGVRLARADTVLVLDFSFPRCAWRAVRRSRERADFWWWVLTWRRRSRPALLAAVREFALAATVYRLRTPRGLERLLQSSPA
jgi:adenylate kinase family enzyme